MSRRENSDRMTDILKNSNQHIVRVCRSRSRAFVQDRREDKGGCRVTSSEVKEGRPRRDSRVVGRCEWEEGVDSDKKSEV